MHIKDALKIIQSLFSDSCYYQTVQNPTHTQMFGTQSQ